ncbi:MAG: hypothetical protein WC975_10770 [Phycisphaerae bacterium]
MLNCVLSCLVLTMVAGIEASGANMALNCPYTFIPEANYTYTQDDGDKVQLTDGKTTKTQCLWTDPLSVGWSWVNTVTITVDLGKVQPITGAGFSTAFGRAGVNSPFSIYLLVSDDGKEFYFLGDLMVAGVKNGSPSPTGYMTHVFGAMNLPGRGRYVRFVVIPSGTYVVCDEVMVYGGKDDQKDLPRGKPVADISELIRQRKLTTIVQGRLAGDLSALERLPGFERQESLWREVLTMPEVKAIQWRQGLPYNKLHRKIWSTHAAWAQKQFKNRDQRLLIWTQNRWCDVHPFDLPTQKRLENAAIDIRMMDGEYRSAVLNLTNLSEQPQNVTLTCNLGQGFPADAVLMREVVFTETQGRKIVGHALPEAKRTEKGWQTSIPAGTTRQMWITLHPQGVKAGLFAGTIQVSCDGPKARQEVPIRLKVEPLRFPEKPTLMTLTWDYCHEGGYIRYDNTRKQAIGLMKEYLINVPVYSPASIPWPQLGKQIDKDGNLTGVIDWSGFDDWIRRWGQDARLFLLYFGEQETIPNSNFTLDSPAGRNALKNFIGQLVKRFELQRIPAERIAILPRDETNSTGKDRSSIAWAKALHVANPKIRVFIDPIWADPTKAVPELFEVSDILCPNRNDYRSNDGSKDKPDFTAFYEKIRRSGKDLMVHVCAASPREVSTYGYFLSQGWFVFQHDMVGNSYWALTDARHVPFGTIGSWNDFASSTTFSIMFWDENGVTPSKQMEAMREAAEDYETLTMLKQAIAKSSGDKANKAKNILDRVVKQVSRQEDKIEEADRARNEVLDQLQWLTGE